jgi:hypothetical protein
MNRLLKAAAALVCAVGLSVCAQAQMTTITATSIKMKGTAVAAGTVTFIPTNALGSPIPITAGGSLFDAQGFTAAITNGAIAGGFQVPDECTAAPTTPNTVLSYQIQVYNTATKSAFTLTKVAGVCGASWALDSYVPTQSAIVAPTGLLSGVTVPAHCSNTSIFYKQGSPSQTYNCVAGIYVPQSGSSGGATLPSTTNLLKGDNAGGALAAAPGTDYPTVASVTSAASVAAAAQSTANAALPKAGGVMTGALTLAADPSSNLQAATKQYVDAAAGAISTGTAVPKGRTGSAGANYYQAQPDGSIQQWISTGNVWVNQTTGVVTYAGAATLIGVTNDYEMNDGTGATTLADAVGSVPLTVNGGGAGGAPAWNGTNGLIFNATNNQYVAVPQSFWAQHSTYTFCANIASNSTGTISLLGQVGGAGIPGIMSDLYGSLQVNGAGGFQNTSTAIQPVDIGKTECYTVVSNGAGADQIWAGTAKLSMKNIMPTWSPATAGLGLGGFFHGTDATIYKFVAAIGTELPADVIQHNALVLSERIATATSQTVATVPSWYKSGSPFVECVGDSKTSGNNLLPNTYCYLLPTKLNMPGVVVLNAGTSGQLLSNYVNNGVLAQSANLVNQYTVVGYPAPPHFSGLYMGINDLQGGGTATALYTNFKQATKTLYSAGYKTIGITLTPSAAATSAVNVQRLSFNTSMTTGGQLDGLVDWANDLRMANPAYPQINGTVGQPGFGDSSPYYQDEALHESALGGAALSGRFMNMMNQLGEIGRGTNYTAAFGANVDIDMSLGHSQTLTLTGNVTTMKVINGNQGDTLDLTVCQDTTGGRTVPAIAVGSGATATVTSAGVETLTNGGSGYDSNYLPNFYVSGLTCTVYPAYLPTISTAGVITAITQVRAGAGCSGTGTVSVVPTEPVWNNFNTSGVNALAAGKCLAQHFVFDDKAQSIN